MASNYTDDENTLLINEAASDERDQKPKRRPADV